MALVLAFFDPKGQQNTSMRVLSFCHGQNDYQWFLLNSGVAFEDDRLEECTNQMRKLGKRDPTDLMKTPHLAYDLGIKYRKLRLLRGL
jgi:hypothetical protein